MPKLKPETALARRDHILEAAERCFAETGFHRTSMQDICRAADVSAGALYVYFGSKEELIAGIAERDRRQFQERFATVASAPDFISALRTLAEYYFSEEPAYRRRMCIEIGLEATRNPTVAEIHRAVDALVKKSFEDLFTRLAAEGRIRPKMDVAKLTEVFFVLGDGLFWRRAIDPSFDPKSSIPAVMVTLEGLLNPVNGVGTYENEMLKVEGQVP
jgi:AcrR family transcriptional regulator